MIANDTAAIHLGIEDFVARAADRLLGLPPLLDGSGDPLAVAGDHVLAPGLIDPRTARLARPAAVLVPVIARDHEATVLLTLRSTKLTTHSGQVAFPGGRMDPHETSPLETALREAEEEVGLARSYVRPLGFLEPYLTGTGFRIAPVVALVSPGFTLAINPHEVDSVFEVPLGFLMSPENHDRRQREVDGFVRAFYAIAHPRHNIWGVTAGIIRRLYEKVYG